VVLLLLLQLLHIHYVSLQEVDVTNEVDKFVVSSHCKIVDESVELAHFILDALNSLFQNLVQVGLVLRHLNLLLLGRDVGYHCRTS